VTTPQSDAGTHRPPVLESVNITAGYEGSPAVSDINLEVRSGEIVALFGANGAGKSTTILALAGVIPSMQGHRRWRGNPTTSPLHRLARDGLMLVPEGGSVITALSARANLQIGRGGIKAALEYFPELEALLERPAGLLSGGEQRMLVLARALAGEPRALLVDELSLGLAPIVVDSLYVALRQAATSKGIAVLLVEQQARRALSITDRWYLLSGGTITGEGDRRTTIGELELAYLASMTHQRNGSDLSEIIPLPVGGVIQSYRGR